MVDEYIARCAHTLRVTLEEFCTEAALWASLDKRRGRSPVSLILADSRGRQYTSGEFAEELAQLRDRGAQLLVLAIGPADGWSPEALRRADRLLSFGKMTLPHELAAALAAEQLYRAATIWSGHPYHGGH
jgi:23S rRNA (pseudouridine1915-N3)-methyltransferase